jgi:DmsE family decaheme c-type cytochrome
VVVIKRFRFCSLFLMVLLITGTVFAGAGKSAAKTKSKDDLYIDNKFCIQCHKEAEQGYLKSPHSDVKNAGSPANELGCQSCHGPGKEHAKSFGAVPIRLSKKSALKPAEKDQSCLQCHNKTTLLAKWNSSIHSKKGGTCIDCHNIHKGFPKGLREATTPKLCSSCHTSFQDKKKLVKHTMGIPKCTSCHNPHAN